MDSDGGVAGRAWGDDDRRRPWSPHRYGFYLTWMAGASRQLADVVRGLPEHARPDPLELALFDGASR
jgi:hypothetical protein